MPEVLISVSWATLARKSPLSDRSVPTMDSATWCRTPAAASAARRLRPEVSKNSSTALSSNEGELARSITTCVPARASLSPSPVIVLIPLRGEAATTSWPPLRRMATVFEPIRPVPPITTIFMLGPPLALDVCLWMRWTSLSGWMWAPDDLADRSCRRARAIAVGVERLLLAHAPAAIALGHSGQLPEYGGERGPRGTAKHGCDRQDRLVGVTQRVRLPRGHSLFRRSRSPSAGCT